MKVDQQSGIASVNAVRSDREICYELPPFETKLAILFQIGGPHVVAPGEETCRRSKFATRG